MQQKKNQINNDERKFLKRQRQKKKKKNHGEARRINEKKSEPRTNQKNGLRVLRTWL